ncbi:hypothetical protein ID856_16385 [Xenorhabdus sp. 18]|uniref:hypothetical protein n=1 Tax=Xenorhabdus doucetiae TaxID=351671 RepID=UPI0019BFA523|nr:hypothetical protein [Xenorhabdus sp. 18]MBD2798091.1 hypothetical protein [Xenorhabdus sp. 18]
MNLINQFIKVTTPLANTNGQGFATLKYPTLVGSFYQCVCFRPFNGGLGRGGFGLAGGYSGIANPV